MEINSIIAYGIFFVTTFSLFFSSITVNKYDKKKGGFLLLIFMTCIIGGVVFSKILKTDIMQGVARLYGLIIGDILVVWYALKIKKQSK